MKKEMRLGMNKKTLTGGRLQADFLDDEVAGL
jgi:hypothetical protein